VGLAAITFSRTAVPGGQMSELEPLSFLCGISIATFFWLLWLFLSLGEDE
jgi:hypothetical protein